MRFKDEYAFLSNMTICPIEYKGIIYKCTENMYQAFKSNNINERIKISSMNPYESKKYGKTIDIRDDWDVVKDKVMLNALKLKFSKPHFAKLLIDIKEPIIEDNYWGDIYWGVCRGVGQNKLGKMLEKIKEEIEKDR